MDRLTLTTQQEAIVHRFTSFLPQQRSVSGTLQAARNLAETFPVDLLPHHAHAFLHQVFGEHFFVRSSFLLQPFLAALRTLALEQVAGFVLRNANGWFREVQDRPQPGVDLHCARRIARQPEIENAPLLTFQRLARLFAQPLLMQESS